MSYSIKKTFQIGTSWFTLEEILTKALDHGLTLRYADNKAALSMRYALYQARKGKPKFDILRFKVRDNILMIVKMELVRAEMVEAVR